MIRSITQPKSEKRLDKLLEGFGRLFIVGCGTCVTLTRTGGDPEVRRMAAEMTARGKVITGHTVVPVACDHLSREILEEHAAHFKQADALLIMTCAYGVQTIGRQLGKVVIPALDTLFIGKETAPGQFDEVCQQCGTCIIGETGGLCPVTGCHKGLVNGPCGGTDDGMCEIGGGRPCVWTQIYNRMKDLGQLDVMRRYHGPRNQQGEPTPGRLNLAEKASKDQS